MYNFDFNAHKQLANEPLDDIQQAIAKANEKADQGQYLVCITTAGDVLVLPEFSASVRDDIAETVYDTVDGYTFASKLEEC